MTRAIPWLLVLSLLASPVLAGEWEEVLIEIPLPARIEVQPGERVLVALFRTNDHPLFAPGLEIARWMRSALGRETTLSIIDVPPPPIPEQRPERLAVNDAFWRQMAEDYDADLIIAGVARYAIEDRSGFETRDFRDPGTGQTVRRSVYLEQSSYALEMQVFFLKGANGALLHDDIWAAERLTNQDGLQEDLQMLFDVLEEFRDDLSAVVAPSSRSEPRMIWTE